MTLGRKAPRKVKKTAAKAVTLAQLDRRLQHIESILDTRLATLTNEERLLLREAQSIKREEAAIEREEGRIEDEEKAILDKENQIRTTGDALLGMLGEHMPRKFENILEWKKYIWEGCSYKKSSVSDKTIDYSCTKLGGRCRFEPCPMNR